MWQSIKDRHARQGCKYGATTNPDYQIYLTSTPLGKAFASVTTEESNRVVKLFDVAYMLAKEEMPFTKYPAIVELEKRLGVSLGSTYGTEHKCQKFTNTIGDCLQDADTLDEIRASRFVTVSLDGSMDNSVQEKE
eukprot:Em0549g2a